MNCLFHYLSIIRSDLKKWFYKGNMLWKQSYTLLFSRDKKKKLEHLQTLTNQRQILQFYFQMAVNSLIISVGPLISFFGIGSLIIISILRKQSYTSLFLWNKKKQIWTIFSKGKPNLIFYDGCMICKSKHCQDNANRKSPKR